MRPHTFKGLPTDRFIGTTQPLGQTKQGGKAFKEVWEVGLNHSWAVLWCPSDELPPSYLKSAHESPNRVVEGR